MLKAWRCLFVVCCISSISLTVGATTIPEISNGKEIGKYLNLDGFLGLKFKRHIKVAVLDNGFSGFETAVGKSLPKNTVYHQGKSSAADAIDEKSIHGLMMANILAEVIKRSEIIEPDYELHLFNAFGYTKFMDAVDTVVNEKFDLVLYSQVWEYGGNGDGRGFINAAVNRALSAGVIWMNAAGNFGKLTRQAAVDGKVTDGVEWVMFEEKKSKKPTDAARFLCKVEAGKKCSLRAVLAWNDFKDNADMGTDKDLDLFLYGKKKNVIKSSELHQMLNKDEKDSKASQVPRELIEEDVGPGVYELKVKITSKNFSPSNDRLRITVSGYGIELVDADEGETLLPPADNPGVIAIGASDDYQTSVSKKAGQPEIYLKSLVKLKDGSGPFSTSNAAAMAGAVAVLHMGTAANPLNRESLIAKIKLLSRPMQKPAPVASAESGSQPPPVTKKKITKTNRNQRQNIEIIDKTKMAREGRRHRSPTCLVYYPLPVMYSEVRKVLRQGGAVPVLVNGQNAIAVDYNYEEAMQMPEARRDERIFITPHGNTILSVRELAEQELPPDYYEVLVHGPMLPLCNDDQ